MNKALTMEKSTQTILAIHRGQSSVKEFFESVKNMYKDETENVE